MPSMIAVGRFDRGSFPAWAGAIAGRDLPLSGLAGWQSNGGHTKGHPARALPSTLDVAIPRGSGILDRVNLVGVFPISPARHEDPAGTVGASIQMMRSDQCVHAQSLIAGRHYGGTLGTARHLGDGCSIELVGRVKADAEEQVALLTLELPEATDADRMLFRDLGTPASFVLYDVLFEFKTPASCPFRSSSGNVSLAELGSVVRVADRFRFGQAVGQLRQGILGGATSLDEARGQALTFLAVIAAALLEMDGSRTLHSAQLEAARALDRLHNPQEVADFACDSAQKMARHVFGSPTGHHDPAVDSALGFIERHFADPITDAQIAGDLGLSTSHFRFLFRSATGQPFQKYVLNLRLEKARQALSQSGMPVAAAARGAGFQSAAHFSRAFSKRFGMLPSALRSVRKR